MRLSDLPLFCEPKHEAFVLPGGRPAALLVHGFPGTPAEMRPLGNLLQPMGWTVQGLLLPGFGAEFGSLGERRYEEWLEKIVAALVALRRRHCPVMLVGYSLGGALAICAAAAARPDGVVLLAPFTWQDRRLYQAGSTFAPFLPRTFRPFWQANLADERVRSVILSAMPGADIDDPEVQRSVRDLVLPISFVRQIFRSGWRAYQRAPELGMPVLVLQGNRDETVLPTRTSILVRRLPNLYRYVEINAGHILIGQGNLAWPTVQEHVMDFAASLEGN